MEDEQINTNGPNPDKPISSEEEDFLGRYPIATRIADMINDLGDDYKHSIVIGIEGEWGEGKTSFVNLILKRIDLKTNLVIEFNPWNFSNQNELIKDFFNSITNALDKIYSRKSLMRRVYEKLLNRFKLYRLRRFCKQKLLGIPYLPRLLRIDILRRGIKLLPKVILYLLRLLGIDIFIKGLGLLLKWIWVFILWLLLVKRPPKSPSKQIKNYSSKLLKLGEISVAPTISILGIVNIRINALWKFRYSDNDSLEDQRKEIDNFLGKLPRRLVIVIDDIDRLDNNETKLIFKLVKLTSNFPNTVFLLAYDRDKVGKRMNEQDGVKGEDYLKKIIQQPFLIPKPDSGGIRRELQNAIYGELKYKGFSLGDTDRQRLQTLINSFELRAFFPTVRDIRRYINSLRLDLKFLDKIEINPIDFIAVEIIRVFVPEAYLAMTNQSLLFTRFNAPGWIMDQSGWKENRDDFVKEVIEKAPEGLDKPLGKIIKYLFPQLRGQGGSERQYRNELRVCSEYMFDKYFLLSIPPSRLSESEISDLLSATSDIGLFTEKLGQIQKEGKLSSLLFWMPEYLDQLDERRSENLLVGIFDFLESMDDGKELETYKEFAWQAAGIVDQVLKRIDDGKRADFLGIILDNTNDLFIMSLILELLIEEIKETRSGKTLLTLGDTEDLKKSYVEKIKKDADAGLLVNRKNWALVLYRWKLWGEEKDVKIYIENMIMTDEGVLSLLREFERMSRHPLAMTVRKILEEFIDLSKLDQRVDTIDRNGLSEDDDRIVELYKNPPKDPRDSS